MTKHELIEFIKADITASGAIPIDKLDDKEITRIIDAESRMAYREWRDAVELKWAVMDVRAFWTKEFKESRTIQLPECVYGIQEFREIKDGARIFGINDPELRIDRIMGTDLWLSPFSSDVIAARTISYSWFDLARSWTLVDIQFRFNVNTHRISVIGHDPHSHVAIRAYVAIDAESLYDDYYFQRWCIATCKKQIHRVLKTFEVQLIGGVTITNDLKSEGEEEIKEIKEYQKEINKADTLMMFH